MRVLYFPSTPLNILVCAAHAHAQAHCTKQKSWLCLVDQKQVSGNIYYQALKDWQGSPFEGVSILTGQATDSAEKIRERRNNFSRIDQLLSEIKPDIIAVGSDRRIEFQYAMHNLQKQGSPAEGWYLDDGLYSYSGRRSRWYKDVLNAALKKITYGFWWREPSLVGTSPWISRVWLFQPEQALPELKNKSCTQLETAWFRSNRLKNFGQQVLNQFDVAAEVLETMDVIIIVPHPNNILKMKGYEQRVKSFVEKLSQTGLHVGIKYHPRTSSPDPLEFSKNENVELIPASLAIEFVLPYVKSSTHVVGDVGTSILTAKWLRPELPAFAVISEADPFQMSFKPILIKLGVEVVADFKDMNLTSRSGMTS